MRSTVFAAAAVSVVALVGFAGAANASATIDLIWIDVTNVNTGGNPICLRPARRNCPQLGTMLSNVAVTDNITLGVIITAGPLGVAGAAVSVNYGGALPLLSVIDFRSLNTPPFLPFGLGTTTNQPPYIDNINAAAFPGANLGIGLAAGQSAYLGTVTFHETVLILGFFEIAVGVDGPSMTDGISNLQLENISDTATFNSAHVLPEHNDQPGCSAGPGPAFMEIEVNALRAGGKTVVTSPNDTTKVTAKARILKGTAESSTTIVTTLTIEAFDGAVLIGQGSVDDITLGVGKGGKGASINVATEQCDAGYIEFVATFRGLDAENDPCVGTRSIRKACR